MDSKTIVLNDCDNVWSNLDMFFCIQMPNHLSTNILYSGFHKKSMGK